jgi:hypothetical protein
MSLPVRQGICLRPWSGKTKLFSGWRCLEFAGKTATDELARDFCLEGKCLDLPTPLKK